MNELEKINSLKIIENARCPLCGSEVYVQDFLMNLEQAPISARWLCKTCGATYEAEFELIDGKVFAHSRAAFAEFRHDEISMKGISQTTAFRPRGGIEWGF